MSIQLLSPQLANQIAAGEVVERPASVVKELLENSIDAGATRIEIDIDAGGHKKILIRDNGKGIRKEELELALSRHATSKIKSLDDLEAITSMGFRGEALASISSVSRLTLTSKPKIQEQAWQAHSEGREMNVTLQPAAHPNGTSINVQDLFFNTPARRRFLRTEKTEFGHIEAVFTRIAIANLTIEFVLTHNGKRVKHVKAVDSLQPRLMNLLGHLRKRTLWTLNQSCEEVSLEGLIVAPDSEYPQQDLQLSYVNARPMRDKLINHAIRQSFEQLGLEGTQPQFVLFVTVNPNDVDVNVHPAKHEVRFHQARLVHDFIASSLRKLIDNQCSLADAEWQPQINESLPAHNYIAPLRPQEGVEKTPGKLNPQRITNGGLNQSLDAQANHYQQLLTTNQSIASNLELLTLNPHTSLVRHRSKSDIFYVDWLKFVRLRLDQEICDANVSQPLLIPVAIPAPKSWSESTRQQFEDLHFQIDKVANKLILKQVPAGWRAMPWSIVFADMIEYAEDLKSHITTILSDQSFKESSGQLENTKQWFLQQPEQIQSNLLVEHASEISSNDIVQLVAANK